MHQTDSATSQPTGWDVGSQPLVMPEVSEWPTINVSGVASGGGGGAQ